MKFLFFLILAVSLRAQAGAETHGGGVFVCRDTKGKIKNAPLAVELIDLWEGMNPYGLEIKRNQSPWGLQVQRAMNRLREWDSPLYLASTFFLAQIRAEDPYEYKTIVNNNIVINPQIADPPFLKRGCPVEGVIAYTDSGDILRVNKNLLRRMPPTDFAALYVHEAVCRGLRSLASDDRDVADRCRLIVAYLFSEEPIPKFELNLPGEIRVCSSDDSFFTFYLFKDQKEKLRARFLRIDGTPISYIQDVEVDNPVTQLAISQQLSEFSMATGSRPVRNVSDYWQYSVLNWTNSIEVGFFEKNSSFSIVHCH